NGVEFKFFTDLNEPNKMDDKPFFFFDITEIKDNQIEELKKFHKAHFDFDKIVNTASDLKYTGELKKIIQSEFSNPSPDLVRLFTKQVYSGLVTAKVLEQFTNLTKKSIQQYLSDIITERLKSALTKEDEIAKEKTAELELAQQDENSNVTTEEELEGFMIVKTILRQKLAIERIHYRDAQSYFAILLDDNNRKTLCRLYLNGNKKYMAILDENKKELRYELLSLDDIFNFSEQLFGVVERLENI